MGRSRVRSTEARAIRGRLRDFAKERYRSWAGFVRHLDVSRTTAGAWVAGNNPGIPDPYWLLRIAHKTNMSLDWLLLGEGPQLRHRPAETPAAQVRAAIEAELRQSTDVTVEEFEGVWTRMMVRPDWREADDAVLRLAVEGVRERFEENLRLMRHYRGLAHVYNSFVDVVRRVQADQPELTSKAMSRFEELLNIPLDHALAGLSQLVEKQKHEAKSDYAGAR